MATKQIAETQTPDPNVVAGALELVKGKPDLPPLSEAEIRGYDEVIQRYARVVRFGWYELGDAAQAIKQRELWQTIPAPKDEEPFHSFEDYINRRAQKSRTAIYRGLQLREGLALVPETDCRLMTQANAIWLLRLSKGLNAKKAFTPKIISMAQTMQEIEFAKYCNGRLPGAAKEEQQETVTWHVDLSLAKILDSAVQVAMWECEADDKRVGIERIMSFWLGSKCEIEGFKNLTNLQAYQKAHGKKREKK